MKSMRLDFPVAGISLNDEQIRETLSIALKNSAMKNNHRARSDVLYRIHGACENAPIDEYDDLREKNGGSPLVGPVFYIP